MKLATARPERVWLGLLLLTPLMVMIIMLTGHARIWRDDDGPRLVPPAPPRATQSPTPATTPTPAPARAAAATPTIKPSPAPTPTAPKRPPTPSPAPEDDGSINLIIPVEGVRPDDLRDTFDAIRSGGRTHRAIDIIAPCGTPAMAATDGEIIRLSRNVRGGNTIYQMSDDKKLVFYYAHLDRYADDIAAGDYARQGDVIGYVGNTGNAGASNCHLHFSIWAITDPKKYWKGDNINPYPILRGAR